ncbi:CBS domain-containing protein [soil metagenome]
MRMRMGEILRAKDNHDVITITPDADVRELIATLAQHNIGALVVSSDGIALDGIVSERDVVRHLHQDGTVINNTVAAIMTTPVQTCSPDDDLDEIMTTMTARRFRHIPVCEGGRVIGIVSIGDVVKHKIGELTFERDQLDGYINQT